MHDTVVNLMMPHAGSKPPRQQSALAIAKRVAPRWWLIARLWFASEERWRARGYAAAAVALSVFTALLLLKVSYVQNAFQSALSEKNKAEFHAAVKQFVWVIAAAAPLFATSRYLEGRLVIEWRRWLAERLLEAYFSDHAYYKLKLGVGGSNGDEGLDNPDQRICDDVRSFASSSVVLVVGLIRKLLYCFMFGGLLWSIAPHLLGYLLLYALVGTWVTTTGFGRRLMHLTYAVLQREADLRFAVVRVRENAESVAFYSGDRHESAVTTARLARAVSVSKLRLWWEAWLGAWTNAYSYATILVPTLLMAPKYFRGEMRFGDISQVVYSFNRIDEAVSYIVNNLPELSGLAAQTDRLDALLSALRSPGAKLTMAGKRAGVNGGSRVEREVGGNGGLRVQTLTLYTPGGEQVLVRDLSLSLSPGQSLLIVGPSGCGKSSILRAVAGLWNLGSGTIIGPPMARNFFLPQKPYMPLGPLRQQLLFPWAASSAAAAAGAAGEGAAGGSGGMGGVNGREAAAAMGSSGSGGLEEGQQPQQQVSDEELEKLLKVVQLPHLAERVGGLGAECDWGHVLSLGEQQRVAMVRLLCHAPTMAFLDEATSAVDADVEAALYAALRERCACYVSIGHRITQLLVYHTHVLEYEGEGRWRLHDANGFERKRRR